MELERKRAWLHYDQPLWLPPGSIRAILVLGLTISLIMIMGKFAVMQQEIPAGVLEIMKMLLGPIVLLIDRYIQTRSQNGHKPEEPTQ